MTDPDQIALANARKALRESPGHTRKSGTVVQGGGTAFENHGRPHLVSFKQDVTIILQKGRTMPDGSVVADGEPEELHYKAGEIVQRPAGIWKITVKSGTADFEKDFEPPASRSDDAPVL